MDAVSLDINAIADSVSLLLWIGVLGVCDGELAIQDQVRSQSAVGMRRVVGVSETDGPD